jgi:V/A-type H+/Na+-transporting ATPase subunit C
LVGQTATSVVATADQAYLNTRVSIMATRLFDLAQITAMAEEDLQALAERFGLAPILDQNLIGRAKSRAIEQALIHTLLWELTLLIRPMTPLGRALVLSWGQLFALTNLKTLIRGKLYDLDQKEIAENLYELPSHVRLDLPRKDLFRAENVLELLHQLERGPYSVIARHAREIYEQRHEPFALAAAIEQRYFVALVRHVSQFHDDNLQPLQALIGAVLDRADLMWLLRFRFSYGLSPSETFYQLVPSFGLMHRERLLALVNLDSLESVLDALPPPLGELLVDSANLIDVQKRMGRYLHQEARRILRNSHSGVARALAYLILRRMDLQLLFALIQGGLLELPRDLVHIAVELAEPNCPLNNEARIGTTTDASK